ncbi:hypothetical protein [Streptomyces venezuelae]|uniref:hypothetical protein n=1 Tax=Streptomyces venezuelae TaxID=54571 RepID=UPI00278BEDB9|nr:hypothetical protein [Streptomyces venezuelae]
MSTEDGRRQMQDETPHDEEAGQPKRTGRPRKDTGGDERSPRKNRGGIQERRQQSAEEMDDDLG